MTGSVRASWFARRRPAPSVSERRLGAPPRERPPPTVVADPAADRGLRASGGRRRCRVRFRASRGALAPPAYRGRRADRADRLGGDVSVSLSSWSSQPGNASRSDDVASGAACPGTTGRSLGPVLGSRWSSKRKPGRLTRKPVREREHPQRSERPNESGWTDSLPTGKGPSHCRRPCRSTVRPSARAHGAERTTAAQASSAAPKGRSWCACDSRCSSGR